MRCVGKWVTLPTSQGPARTSQPRRSPTPGFPRFSQVRLLFYPSPTCGHAHRFPVVARSVPTALAAEACRLLSGRPTCFKFSVGPSRSRPLHIGCYVPIHTLHLHVCTQTRTWARVTHLPDPPSNQPESRNNWVEESGWGNGMRTTPVRGEVALPPGQDGPHTH